MSFNDFHGNREIVTRLREMLARDRFPHAVILAGPEGAGKYTLAQMLAKSMNCLQPVIDGNGLPDYCGRCSNCVRIAESDDLNTRFAEAVEARENLRDADKKDTRIFVQSHPEVLAIPPDPPQMLIKLGQVRRVIETIYYKPSEARRRVYIFTDSAFMKEAANSLLKILEEPPDFATIFLLTTNAGELLPTIRSRCISFTLGALPTTDIEQYLAAEQPEWNVRQRQLVARLSGGAIGKARSFDLAAYSAGRADAMAILQSSIQSDDHSPLFRITETYRAGAEGKEKTDQLVRAVYSLLEDLLFIQSNTPELVRNTDILPELKKLAALVEFEWIAQASQKLGQLESGMRRNLLRSLSLDAFATALEK
ncbi:MAG: polymerase delta prime subunit [Acidobacteriaceae bacterium]|nr:polymerase delta prime subunit [Acidobacteriaceae bacterium]